MLATIENSDEVVHILLPPLMKLGVASLLINLLDFEMSKLMSEREPERFVDNPSAAEVSLYMYHVPCVKLVLHLFHKHFDVFVLIMPFNRL